MIVLSETLAEWGGSNFEKAFKKEIQCLDKTLLPLQEGLSQTSFVSDSAIEAVVLNSTEKENGVQVKAGIFYSGVNSGSCCADDPTPVSEQTEYCEIQFVIDKQTAKTTAALIK